jgi:phosphatidylserine decarboxylase
MKPIFYIDRESDKIQEEKVYAGALLAFLYANHWIQCFLRNMIARTYFVSALVGWWYRQPWTASSIAPFIKNYSIDPTEFLDPIASFRSFNDFFIRRLDPKARPIDPADAVIPADARYWFYESIHADAELMVKGKSLNLTCFLGNASAAKRFEGGSLVMARLCPSDYHRFHFPVDCVPYAPQLLNGPLFSVNPIAVKQNLAYLTENKRKLTYLESDLFGEMAYVEIGATTVGSIVETFIPHQFTPKGSEKGYFEFGGSALILLFQPNTIAFSPELLKATRQGMEIRCLVGQKMGLVNI